MTDKDGEPSGQVAADAGKDARILIVDDEEPNVELLVEILAAAGFRDVVSTTDSRRAVDLFEEARPDLILLDLHMPHLDGFAVLERLGHRIPRGSNLPILVLTAEASLEAKRRALSRGARDFLTKPFDITEVILRIRNLLETRRLHTALARQNAVLEERVQERTAHLWEAVQRLQESEAATRAAIAETIRHLASAAELRDEETGRHIERMSRYCGVIAARIGYEEERCDLIRLAASMHDIGKIGVPDRILRKKGKLTAAEMEEMRTHADVGFRILEDSHAEVIELAALIALTHHERFDGGGYPRGLVGEVIPIEGRIAAVADVFDALTSNRVYRRALPLGQAIDIMRAERGRHFDSELLDVFLGATEEVLEIWQRYPDSPGAGPTTGRGRRARGS